MLKRAKIFYLIGILAVLYVLSSCGDSDSTEVINQSESSYKKVLSSGLLNQLGDEVNDIEFLFSEDTEFGMLSHFMFKKGSTEYEGLVNFNDSNEIIIENMIYERINRNVPFTHIELSATEGDRVFRIVGGQINSNDIDYILVSFYNGTLIKVLKSEMNGYAYVDLDDSGGVISIKGYDNENKLIFEY